MLTIPFSLAAALLAGCATDDGSDSAAPASSQPAAVSDESTIQHYASAETCAGCHPRQYEEWKQSMHRYGARSPVFEGMYLKAYRDSAGEVGPFCTNCHSAEAQADNDPGSITVAERDALELEGITCTFCHSATGHDGPTGDMNIAHNDGTVRLGPYDDPVSAGYHEAGKGDFIVKPEFCGSCHDVFKFPGLQIEEAFTEYVSGPAAAEGTRCQDCHMGPEPGVPSKRPMGPSAVISGKTFPDREQVSHRWIGPDYTLLPDFPYADDLQASADARAEYLTQTQKLLEHGAHLLDAGAVRNGETVTVTVNVENQTKGHNVPTGFTSERQLWVAITATDRNGQVVFQTGNEDSYGDVRDIHSWDVQDGVVELDDQLVNFQSTNVMLQRGYNENGQYDDDANDGEIQLAEFPFQAQYVDRHSLEPLEIRPLTYTFRCSAAPCSMDVSLHYRNLPPYALRALQRDQYIEKLHEFTIGELSVDVQ